MQTRQREIAPEAKTNPKKFFSTYIRTKKNVKSNIGPIANEYGVLTQDCGQMAKILNTNFASVFTLENRDTVPVSPAPPIEIAPLEIDNITEQEVQNYLDKHQVNKSTISKEFY